jgi:hypothetical protein
MKLKCITALLLGLGFVTCGVLAQQQGGFNFAARAREALAQPFTGITSSGSLRSGLYEIKKTGVSTAPVLDAARNLLASLSMDQRKKILFPVDDPEWRNWANVHRFQRQGVSLEEMNEEQQKKAYALLRASLSAKGYQTSRDIMRLNHHLAELVSNFDEYGEHLYWFTIMGNPSMSEPWGWQIDGHHLIINYFVIGNQVVMTPTFMGSEPVKATSGKYTGVSILRTEQDLGLEFMQSLPPNQQQAALIGAKDGRSENLAEMFKDNITVPFAGLAADRLSKVHRDQLMELIDLYVGNINDDHSKIKIDEVRTHLDETYFAWKGDMGADAVFYYRIQSPVILIEFDHQGPIALAGSRKIPTRHHIHTVVRTPNGNDYGKSLLQQHYDRFKNDSEHSHTMK